MQVCLAGNAQSATAPKVDFEVVFFLSRKSMENIVMCVHIALRGSLESSESLWVVAWMSFERAVFSCESP